MKHFDVSREVSVENSNFNHIKDDSNPVCMSGECASFSNSTNTNAEFNSCSFNNSKVHDKKLSSHSSLSQECDQNILNSGDLQNKEYFATNNWELYSEANMKCSRPGGDMLYSEDNMKCSRPVEICFPTMNS